MKCIKNLLSSIKLPGDDILEEIHNAYFGNSEDTRRTNMANVKQIEISGEIPFNAHEDSDELLRLYGQLNTPSNNLRIEWSGGRFVDNIEIDPNHEVRNGKTAVYQFRIFGTEAVSYGWFDKAIETIEAANGTVQRKICRDIEN